MVTIDEVREFLSQFNTKLQIWGIVYRDDRPKNIEALRENLYGQQRPSNYLYLIPSCRKAITLSV